jgi:hypothetical protein
MFIELECSPPSSALAGRHVTPDGAEDLSGFHGAINISPLRAAPAVLNSPTNMSHTPSSATIRVISSSPPMLPNSYSLASPKRPSSNQVQIKFAGTYSNFV